MSESRGTEIKLKLFGKTITSMYRANQDDDTSSSPVRDCSVGKEISSSSSSSFEPDKVKKRISDENISFKHPLISSSDLNVGPKPASENNVDQHSEITTVTRSESPPPEEEEEEKTALTKKPDKILPCPRCDSRDTKFCYFNNYNVNQPRHFCKNCQRYWTAGGSMRNVPFGSGRRKNRGWGSPVSNQYIHVDSDNNIDNIDDKNPATILDFASSGPQDFNPTAGSASHDVKNYPQGFLAPQVTFPIPPPWNYRWNSPIPNGNFYPVPFYWGCTVPMLSPNTSTCPGKRTWHQTEGESNKDTRRTRLVSSEEASRRFLRSTTSLTTGQDKVSVTKGSNRNFMSETTSSLALQANPAALARSLNFHENKAVVTDKI